MPLTCNIDARGKAIRLVYGGVLFVAGLVLLVCWAIRGGGGIAAWAISCALIAGGAFALFEARAGWCVIRAMGFKTPI